MKEFPALVKIILLIGLSSLILTSFNMELMIVVLAVLIVAISFTKSRKKIFPRLKALFPAGLLIFLLQLSFSPGVPLNDKLLFSFTVFSKLVVVSLMVLYFVSTTSPVRIVSAFFFLSENMRLMLTMTFYFIPIILDEAGRITVIQKSRGLKSFSWNIMPLVVPLLHRVFARAQALSLTLVSRGFEH
jgi:energy-coupling factor transporter transmembrane protein EcfT